MRMDAASSFGRYAGRSEGIRSVEVEAAARCRGEGGEGAQIASSMLSAIV